MGTYFYQSAASIKKRKFWIGYAAIPKGTLIVDDGACNALNNNKSLLAKGVTGVIGRFQAGDIVSIVNDNKEIAKGKIRYSSADVNKIMGTVSSEIYNILGYKVSDEIIHKDDLIII